MDPIERAFERLIGGGKEEDIDRGVEAIFEALEREPLTSLKFGDVLKQKQWGTDYKYHGDDKVRVVFIRYLPVDPMARFPPGKRVEDCDILIAFGVHKADGTVMMYAADSRFFEKA